MGDPNKTMYVPYHPAMFQSPNNMQMPIQPEQIKNRQYFFIQQKIKNT